MNSREILTAKKRRVCNGKFCAAVAVFALLCYSMFKERLMEEGMKRLFVGIKINKALQDDLDSPAPGMKQYFDGNSKDYLQVIDLGEAKLIGRYLKDGFPAAEIGDVSRNVCSIVRLITRGRRIEDNDVQIYSC